MILIHPRNSFVFSNHSFLVVYFYLYQEAALQALNGSIEQLQSELLVKDANISTLSSETEQLKKEIVGREAQISKLTADADWLKKELAAKDELLAVEKNVVNNLYFGMLC